MNISVISVNEFKNAHINNKSAKKNLSDVSFGLHNPKAALFRAQQLKAEYAKAGINYLLPNETWNNAKIQEKINVLRDKINNVSANKLTKDFVQKQINKILPKNKKGMCEIYDMDEISKKNKFSEEQINFINKASAITKIIPANNKIQIYLPFKNLAESGYDPFMQMFFKTTVLHEVTHLLNNSYQNVSKIAHFNMTKTVESNDPFSFIFNYFEDKFSSYFSKSDVWDKVEALNVKELLKLIGLKSQKALLKEFDANLNNSISDELKLKYKTKQFYEYCKFKANDEREAYKTNDLLRDNLNPNTPIKIELKSVLYSEMAKFFSAKAKQTKI